MLIDVLTHGFEATDAIVQQAQHRVDAALAGATWQVTRLTVRFGDINGDHGGNDKLCRIMASLRSRRPVVVEAIHRNLYVALDHAAGKLKHALERQIGRRNTLHREREWSRHRTALI